tara:strand:+ start:9421 stop:10551 length:1131 start_codon:yes stop_codon:yes gene_type:complete
MAGYTRQSVASILNGESVTAPPINAEFNQLQSAFDAATGHSHDGSSGNAQPVALATSVSGYLPAANGGVGGKNSVFNSTNPTQTDDSASNYAVGSIWVNTTSDIIFICFDSTASAAIWQQVGTFNQQKHMLPENTGISDIGSTSKKFKDLHLSGTATVANVDGVLGATTPAAVTGTVITANTNFAGPLTGAVTGNVAGDLTGDVKATNGTTVLENGSTGSDAVFTGSVTGNVTGNVNGNLTGNSTGTHTGTVDANNTTLTNLTDPVNNQDAATKKYVTDQLSLGVNSVDQFRADAQLFAINPEDSQFTTSTSITGFSALHYAAKASASSTAATSSQNAASTSETNAAQSAITASAKAALLSNFVDSNEKSLIGVLI